MIWAILISLLVGGLATSLAEYKLNYNLVDFIKELFGKAKNEEQLIVNKAKSTTAKILAPGSESGSVGDRD